MNSRRDFLRASGVFLIGPSFLRNVHVEKSPEELPERIRNIGRLLLESKERLLQHKGVLIAANGKCYAGPEIEEIEFKNSSLVFTFQKSEIKERFNEKLYIAIYSPEGEFRIKRELRELGLMNPGDRLYVTYLIDFSGLC